MMPCCTNLQHWLSGQAKAAKHERLLKVAGRQPSPCLNGHIVVCKYKLDAPTQGASVELGTFVLEYAVATLQGTPMHVLQGIMPATRQLLTEKLLSWRLGVS